MDTPQTMSKKSKFLRMNLWLMIISLGLIIIVILYYYAEEKRLNRSISSSEEIVI